MKALIKIHPVISFVSGPHLMPILFHSEEDAILEIENFDEEPNVDKLVKVTLRRKGSDIPVVTAMQSRYQLQCRPFLVWQADQEGANAADNQG